MEQAICREQRAKLPNEEAGEILGDNVNFDRKSGVNICLLCPNCGILVIFLDDGDNDDIAINIPPI